jgi:hypothetical protein
MLQRNWALIAFVYLAFAEVLSLAPVPDLSLCLIEPEHSQQSADHNDKKYCPAFHTGVIASIDALDGFLERHDKSVLGGFTIVLAISTIGLWLATNKLWEAGERQLNLLAKTSADQSRDMQGSIAASEKIAISAETNSRVLLGVQRAHVYHQTFELAAQIDDATDTVLGFYISSVWRNYGQSPAINFGAQILEAVIEQEGQEIVFDFSNSPLTRVDTLGPGVPKKVGFRWIPIATAMRAWRGEIGIFIYFGTAYNDIFSAEDRSYSECSQMIFGTNPSIVMDPNERAGTMQFRGYRGAHRVIEGQDTPEGHNAGPK